PDVPSEAATWNRFVPSQTLVISFYDPVSTRYYGLIATVQGFRPVSEPSSVQLAGIAVGFLCLGVSCLRRARVVVSCAFVVLLFVRSAGAGTYRVELTDITNDTHPDANYLQASYDFGTTFRSIDSVSLEL